MKRLFSFLLLLFVVVASFAISVGSPNQRIKLFFELGLKDSVPTYQVFFDDRVMSLFLIYFSIIIHYYTLDTAKIFCHSKNQYSIHVFFTSYCVN